MRRQLAAVNNSGAEPMSKPIVLILGCRKYRPSLDAAIQRMQSSAWETIGVLGDPAQPTQFDGRVLSLGVEDAYETNPVKLHTAFAWITRNRPDASGIFKTDDDMVYPDLGLLQGTIEHHVGEHYWGVHVAICRAGPVDHIRIRDKFARADVRHTQPHAVYSFGAGYWVSRSAMSTVISSSDHFEMCLEDVWLGYVMNKAGHYPLWVPVPCEETPRPRDNPGDKSDRELFHIRYSLPVTAFTPQVNQAAR